MAALGDQKATRSSTNHVAVARHGYLKSTQSSANHAARRWRGARRPPRCAPARLSVAQWEKDFCEANGVPWKKVTDPHAGLNAEGPCGRVAQWDDSGAVEALLAAKRRYWSEINGGVGAPPPLPDPDMYIDVIVDHEGGGAVDAEIEAEYQAAVRDMVRARDELSRMRAERMREDYVPVPTGWDV